MRRPHITTASRRRGPSVLIKVLARYIQAVGQASRIRTSSGRRCARSRLSTRQNTRSAEAYGAVVITSARRPTSIAIDSDDAPTHPERAVRRQPPAPAIGLGRTLAHRQTLTMRVFADGMPRQWKDDDDVLDSRMGGDQRRPRRGRSIQVPGGGQSRSVRRGRGRRRRDARIREPSTRFCRVDAPEVRGHATAGGRRPAQRRRQGHKRQFALVDRRGRVAAYTGADLHTWDGWAGSTAGRHCVALGNGLASSDVVDRMVRTFEGSRASLAERLMAALESGQRAGGDIRGQQSAALLVLRRNGGYGSLDDRHVVISIYDHEQPIDELVRCYALHRLSYFPSEPSKLVPIGPELALELKGFMAARGFYEGSDWTASGTRLLGRRWELFLGSENYDNRINNGGMLDLEVLADLRRRYGQSAVMTTEDRLPVAAWAAGSPSSGDGPAAPAWCIGVGSNRLREGVVAMCRWMAYSGDPILAHDLLFRPSTRSSTRACTPSSAGSPRTVTASASGGTATATEQRRPCSRAPIRPGTTRTCARSPRRSARRCCSRTCAPRAERRCSAATATRSGTGGGCGCTTGRSPGSTRSSAIC